MIGILVIQVFLLLGQAEPRFAEGRLFKGMTSNYGSSDGTAGNLESRVAEERVKCADLNGDICGCVLHNCSVNVADGNSCIDKILHCESAFGSWQGECRRENTYYSIGGNLCHNKEQKGDCDIDFSSKSNFGVNLNGRKYKDSHGVQYVGHNETMNLSNNGNFLYKNASLYGTSICKREGRGNIVKVVSHRKNITEEDKSNLLWSYVEDPTTTGNYYADDVCLSLQINFYDDGLYELNLKIAEMEHFHQMFRQFNVKLNGKIIFPEVDIVSLGGSYCVAIDLTLNFRILKKQHVIEMSGFAPLELTRKSATTLDLCPSSCGEPVMKSGYTLSAVSVTKLGPSCQH